MTKPLGQRIKKFRQNRGMTLQAVAGDLGLTPAAMSHWESGRITPNDRKLQDLALVLRVEFADLKGSGAINVRRNTPIGDITEILTDARKRIADCMGCQPQEIELEWRVKGPAA